MTPESNLPSHPRSGVTLIESLVAIAIIGVLVALILPAVQGAREAANRARCAHQLRQIGLAVQQHHDAFGAYPAANTNDGQSRYVGLFSPHARLLPFLDQGLLYNGINFAVGTFPPEEMGLDGIPPRYVEADGCNQTASSTRVALFLCPSDSGSLDGAETSFRANTGVGPEGHVSAEYPDSGNGLFPEAEPPVTMSRVPDGLSHTAVFSERVLGSGRLGRPIPERDYFAWAVVPTTADALLIGCRASARPGAKSFVKGGRWWFWTGRDRTLYNHAQAPNGTIPDCIVGSIQPTVGMATARSRHPGGVNVLMGDGSVRFVGEGINQMVWRGLGTRNGRELVD